MKTEKQKQACNRNFSIMQLSSMQQNLKSTKIRCNNSIIKREIDLILTHLEYIRILCEESTTSDWNSTKL